MESEQLESARKLFFLALCIDLVINTIVGFKTLTTIDTFKAIESGALTMDQALFSNIEFWSDFSKLAIITMICVGLALVRWLNACYRYAKDTIGASGFKNENWTAGGWIIPIVSLFKPYQIISEIYKAGAPNYVGTDDWSKESGSSLLLAWWIFWSVTHFILIIISKLLLKTPTDDATLSQIIGAYELQVGVYATSIIVIALWFWVANLLTARLIDRQPIESPSSAKSQLPAHSQASPSTSNTPVEPEFAAYQRDEFVQATAAPIMSVLTTPATIANGNHSVKVTSSKLEANAPPSRLLTMADTDDWAYEQVAVELDQNNQDKAQWTRAFAETGGDENKTKALYIQRRVQRIVAIEAERIQKPDTQREADIKEQEERFRQEKQAEEELRLKELEAAKIENDRQVAEEARLKQLVLEQERLALAMSKQSSASHPSPANMPKDVIGQSHMGKFTAAGVVIFLIVLVVNSNNQKASPPKNIQKIEQQVTVGKDAYALGLEAYKRNDFAGAIQEWKPLAIQGDANAQIGMMSLYANGYGVAQDDKQAFDWCQKAAAQGNPQAQSILGNLYSKGNVVPQNFATAFEWYQKAAAQGHGNAQTSLGWSYEQALGVQQNFAEAAKWYRLAAEQGNSYAQNNLGLMYERGRYFEQNDNEALRWYRLVVAQGAKVDTDRLASHFSSDQLTERSLQKVSLDAKP